MKQSNIDMGEMQIKIGGRSISEIMICDGSHPYNQGDSFFVQEFLLSIPPRQYKHSFLSDHIKIS